ncbi:MAG: hypothetical protein AAFV69_09725, partial [Pseudomonadota bacterium]
MKTKSNAGLPNNNAGMFYAACEKYFGCSSNRWHKPLTEDDAAPARRKIFNRDFVSDDSALKARMLFCGRPFRRS